MQHTDWAHISPGRRSCSDHRLSDGAYRLVGLASLPSGVTLRHLIGAGCLGGIGFTMPLFIAHLAFESPVYMHQAKGVLAASVIARLIG